MRAGLTFTHSWVVVRWYPPTCPRRHDSFLHVFILSDSPSFSLSCHRPYFFYQATPINYRLCALMIIAIFNDPVDPPIHWATLHPLLLLIVSVYLWQCHLLLRLLLQSVDCLCFSGIIHTLNHLFSLITNESIWLDQYIAVYAAQMPYFMNLGLVQMTFPLNKRVMAREKTIYWFELLLKSRRN